LTSVELFRRSAIAWKDEKMLLRKIVLFFFAPFLLAACSGIADRAYIVPNNEFPFLSSKNEEVTSASIKGKSAALVLSSNAITMIADLEEYRNRNRDRNAARRGEELAAEIYDFWDPKHFIEQISLSLKSIFEVIEIHSDIRSAKLSTADTILVFDLWVRYRGESCGSPNVNLKYSYIGGLYFIERQSLRHIGTYSQNRTVESGCYNSNIVRMDLVYKMYDSYFSIFNGELMRKLK
jgi:hypothetical protein